MRFIKVYNILILSINIRQSNNNAQQYIIILYLYRVFMSFRLFKYFQKVLFGFPNLNAMNSE